MDDLLAPQRNSNYFCFQEVFREAGSSVMNRTKQEDNFSNNVIWYNYILCILVIFIHARNDGIFTVPVWISGIPVFNELEAFLASDVAGAAVGGFYLSSGYLFFRSYSWKIGRASCRERV